MFFAYLIGFCELVGGYDTHRDNVTALLKNVTMAGGFFALAIVGAGTISLFGGAPSGASLIFPEILLHWVALKLPRPNLRCCLKGT